MTKSGPPRENSPDGRPRSEIPENPCFAVGVDAESTSWKTSRYVVPAWRISEGETGPPGEKSHALTSIVIVCVPPGVGVRVGVDVAVGPVPTEVFVGVGGLKPAGAATSGAPTTRMVSW